MDLKPTICVVEDEADLRDVLCYNLEKDGYNCVCFSEGAAALDQIQRQPPDLVLLDRMLPGRSGDEIARAMQRDDRLQALPIIMLTAKGEESDQLVGFALGAIDYIVKPFSMKVLLARVGAVLRRGNRPAEYAEKKISRGPVVLDAERHEVTVDSVPVSLTTTEFRILRTLMAAAGRVLDRNQVIDSVLGPHVAVTDRTVDVHIAALRKKLGGAAGWVQTVRGVGYTFREPQ